MCTQIDGLIYRQEHIETNRPTDGQTHTEKYTHRQGPSDAQTGGSQLTNALSGLTDLESPHLGFKFLVRNYVLTSCPASRSICMPSPQCKIKGLSVNCTGSDGYCALG
jgi:hypothetical protein